MPGKADIRKGICKRMIKAMHYVKMTDSKIQEDRQFAEMLGTTPARVADWKKGVGCPTETNMHVMRKKYHINLNWLITGKGEMVLQEGDRLERIESKLNRLLRQ